MLATLPLNKFAWYIRTVAEMLRVRVSYQVWVKSGANGAVVTVASW